MKPIKRRDRWSKAYTAARRHLVTKVSERSLLNMLDACRIPKKNY